MLLILVIVCAGMAAFIIFAGDQLSLQKVQGFALQTKVLHVLSVLGQQRFLRVIAKQEAWRTCEEEMRASLLARGVQLTAEQSTGALVVCCAAGALGVSVLLGHLESFVLCVPASAVCVLLIGKRIENQRREKVEKALPDAYRSLAGSLTSGQTLPQAMSYVGRHVPGEVGYAFKLAALTFSCGGSVHESLHVIEEHLQDSSCELLICALSVSQKTGAPLAHLLHQAAELVEEKAALKKLLTTKTAQVRMSVQVVMVLPVLLVAALALLSPDFQRGLLTPLGLGTLFVAGVLDVCALLAMKKIISGVSFL